MKKWILILLIYHLAWELTPAQTYSLSWASVNTGGSTQISSGGLRIAQTLGQTMIGNLQAGNHQLTQGFQQCNTVITTAINAVLPFGYQVNIYPNPCIEEVNITFLSKEPGRVRVDLLDLHARPCTQGREFGVQVGENQVRFLLPQLPGGMYWVRLSAGNQQRMLKLHVLGG